MAGSTDDIQVQRIELLREEPETALRSLFSQYESRHPQFGLDWLTNLSRTSLAADARPLLYVARRAPGELAVLPLLIDAGRAGQALGNFYTSLYTPLSNSPEPAPLFVALFRHLARREALHTLTLAPMDPDGPLYGPLQRALRAAGWRGVHDFFCFANWSHQLAGADWEDYLGSRSSRVRNTVRRRRRKFLADNRGELEIIAGGAELESAIARFNRVYRASWKQPEPFPEFMPGLMRLAAKRGWLRLGLAYYDGQAIASQAWLVSGDSAYIFKLAYDRRYAALSPGTVLSAHLMAHVISRDGVTRIDYLTGDDRYKRDWMSLRREYRGIAASNPATLRGRAALLRYRLGRLSAPLRRRIAGYRRRQPASSS